MAKKSTNVIKLDEHRKDMVSTKAIRKFLKDKRLQSIVIVGIPHNLKEPAISVVGIPSRKSVDMTIDLLELVHDNILEQYEE